MSHVTCHMSYVKCLCWSLGHAEQLLFSCLGSKVTLYSRKLQCFFWDIISSITLTCYWRVHRAGSKLKIRLEIISIAFPGQLPTATCWKRFVWCTQCYRINVWTSDKRWEPEMLLKNLSHSFTHSFNLSFTHSLTLNMLNYFCFHVYA